MHDHDRSKSCFRGQQPPLILGIPPVRCHGQPWLQDVYSPRYQPNSVMPAVPNRSRKVLEELARVCNKLATELTADLKHAVNEIENLKREIHKIRRPGATATGTSRNKSKRTSRAKTSTATHSSQKKTTARTHISESARQKGPAHESASFVFPKEPFNPPTPPAEPTTGPENN